MLSKNESTKRVFWNMGTVESLLYGQDDSARAAIVKVANGEAIKSQKVKAKCKTFVSIISPSN